MSTGPSDTQRQAVYDRADGRCERCRVHVPFGTPPHHRRPRGMGGSSVPWINDPSNLVFVCQRCHQDIESNRTLAYDRGLLVRYGDDPSDVPAVLWCGRVFLSDRYISVSRDVS